MKLLLVIFFMFLIACKKSDNGNGKYCWHCEFSSSTNGTTPPPRDTCWEHDYAPHFRDANNNDLGGFCREQ
jgi:hypothetical protein